MLYHSFMQINAQSVVDFQEVFFIISWYLIQRTKFGPVGLPEKVVMQIALF